LLNRAFRNKTYQIQNLEKKREEEEGRRRRRKRGEYKGREEEGSSQFH